MPQEFAQQQEQASQQPQEQAVAVDTSQTDGTVNALDAVLDDIESVLEQTKAARLSKVRHRDRYRTSEEYPAVRTGSTGSSASKPNTASA